MSEPTCPCHICLSRQARGEPPLPGLSVSTAHHVTAQELEPWKLDDKDGRKPSKLNGAATSEVFVAKSQIRSVVRAEIGAFMDRVLAPAVGKSVGEIVHEAVCESEARVEAKIAALADAANVFKGVWAQGTRYERGSIVSIPALGIYRAVGDTETRPGHSDAWQLLLKAGRDGRDGKDAVEAVLSASQTKSHR